MNGTFRVIYTYMSFIKFCNLFFFSFCSTKDPNTVFVSNLLFSVDEERLKDVFLPVKITQENAFLKYFHIHYVLLFKEQRFINYGIILYLGFKGV